MAALSAPSRVDVAHGATTEGTSDEHRGFGSGGAACGVGGDNDGSALKLVKGGLRALTGAIAKQNPDAYRVDTPVATLGVRGIEFDVRWCDEQCADKEQRQTDEQNR